MGDSFNREEFVTGYLAEADEHLQSAGQNLLRIEGGLANAEPQGRLVRELFRSLHTLKGLSAMVGVEPIVAIAHEMETILRVADQSANALSRAAVELLLAGLRAIEQRIRAFSRREPVPVPAATLISALQAQAGAASTSRGVLAELSLPAELLKKLTRSEHDQLVQGLQSGQRAVRFDFAPAPDKTARGISITSVREAIGNIAEIVKVVPVSAPKTPASPGGLIFTLLVLSNASNEELARAAGIEVEALLDVPRQADSVLAYESTEDRESTDDALRTDSIRVPVARLDDALEKLSALVVNRFRLIGAVQRLRQQGADVREMDVLLNELTRDIKQLRGSITRARMVPVEELLERVPLLVRGMSKSAGKNVRLHVDAGQSELDKGVAERLFPAILHLVRNAIDHAIEAPAERARLGKPELATITIRAHERSDNQLELSVSDDGAGIDRERVARKAGQPIPEDDATLLALITRPGLSTRDVANEHSGRGMGMDIVKRVALGTLGGDLTLKTTPNQGTTFTLRVPLSISILNSLSFRCGTQIFVAPLAMVDEIVELSGAQVVHGPQPRRAALDVSLLRQRDTEIPLFDLKALLQMSTRESASAALVVCRSDKRFAFGVDKVLSQQELVIRPLEDPLVKIPGISGTTDLGDGLPTLVLDLVGLSDVALARAREVQA